MILGIGVDIVELDRIERLVEKHGDSFLNKIFTESEIAYCQARRHSSTHFAGRFAAKEAVLKALGTGLRPPIRWTDVEVRRGDSGPPTIHLARGAKAEAAQQGVARVHISISHSRRTAVAYAIAEGNSQ